jgi:hypothetical protein
MARCNLADYAAVGVPQLSVLDQMLSRSVGSWPLYEREFIRAKRVGLAQNVCKGRFLNFFRRRI